MRSKEEKNEGKKKRIFVGWQNYQDKTLTRVILKAVKGITIKKGALLFILLFGLSFVSISYLRAKDTVFRRTFFDQKKQTDVETTVGIDLEEEEIQEGSVEGIATQREPTGTLLKTENNDQKEQESGSVTDFHLRTTPTPQMPQTTPTSQPTPIETPTSTNTPTPASPTSMPTLNSSEQIPLKASFKATGFRNTGVFPYITEIFKGDTVYFDASESTGDIVSYEWDFGDGTTGRGKTISHTYRTDLFTYYNVRLTVKDKNGQTDATGGYYIHYIGEPRMLISVEPIPEARERKYVCGQTIKAKANTYSPYGEVTKLEWELIRGAISNPMESDKILKTKITDKDGVIEYYFDCDTILKDAALQNRDRNAVYSFVVRKMTDDKGNGLLYSNNNYYGGIGSVTIVVYNP